MKKTSDFRFWSRIGAGFFCLIAFAAFYIKAALIKPEVSVARFDTNASGVPDLIRVYHDGRLQRELIDLEWTDVYTYRVYWSEKGGVKRVEKMLDVKKWLYEYYLPPHKSDNVEKFYKQKLDQTRTFAALSSKDLAQMPYDNVVLSIKNDHIFAAEYFKQSDSKPFLVVLYDKYGRYSEVYRDLNDDGLSDEKFIYEGGILMSRLELSEPLPFDIHSYTYKGKK